MYKVEIPEISDERVIELAKQIKPIVKSPKDGKRYFLRELTAHELVHTSYPWLEDAYSEEVDEAKYIPVKHLDFECLHKYGYYGLFKPSVAEVFAQLTEDQTHNIHAFEIIESPQVKDDFSKYPIQFNNGFHVSKVRLFSLADSPRGKSLL